VPSKLLLLLLLLLWLYSPLLGLGRFFSLLILYTVDRTPRTGISSSQDLYLHTEHKHRINTQNTHIHALVGFEPTITVFERAKTVHALDRAATVIGKIRNLLN
jgi:hypothetical protein